MTLAPCLECGEPADKTRCPDCTSEHSRAQPDRKTPPAARGYDAAWNKLSRRARRMQPFCTDCGATTDLQADHSPEAWKRKAAGLPLRLKDIDVVCGYHNRQRGAQRPNERPPGGIPAGKSPETHTQESNFASHIVGLPARAHEGVGGGRNGRQCGCVEKKAAFENLNLPKGAGLPVGEQHLCITDDPSFSCHVRSVS